MIKWWLIIVVLTFRSLVFILMMSIEEPQYFCRCAHQGLSIRRQHLVAKLLLCNPWFWRRSSERRFCFYSIFKIFGCQAFNYSGKPSFWVQSVCCYLNSNVGKFTFSQAAYFVRKFNYSQMLESLLVLFVRNIFSTFACLSPPMVDSEAVKCLNISMYWVYLTKACLSFPPFD